MTARAIAVAFDEYDRSLSTWLEEILHDGILDVLALS